jgi:hypothetical protein
VSTGAGDVVTVVSTTPFVLRDVVVSAGGVEARVDVVEVRTVEEPAMVITVVEPQRIVLVQSGPLAAVTPGGDATYTFFQLTPAAEWRIPHPMGKHPAVTVQDSAGRQVVGEVQYLGDDLVVVTFRAPFSGRADLN